jgi:hypothetical protein
MNAQPLTARLRRCSDSVSYMIYFCPAGEATTMPLHDPKPSCCSIATSGI